MPTATPIATRLSTKGQVVLPKVIRDRRSWRPGTDLVWEETADGVLLRNKAPARVKTVDDIIGIARYTGPRLSEKEMDERIARSLRAEYGVADPE